MINNPPSNAEDTGSTLGRGTKGPHAVQQLSWGKTTAEPACSGADVPNLESVRRQGRFDLRQLRRGTTKEMN